MARFAFLAVALATCLSPIMAHPANGPRDTKFGCGVVPTAEFLGIAKDMAAEESTSKNAVGLLASDVSALATISVKVYFHVVARSNSASGGYVTAAQITQQLAVMNNNYGE